MNIIEALNMEKNLPVLDLRVMVEKVMDRKAGESAHGPWSFQDMLVKDSTGEIWVKCEKHPDLMMFKGTSVVLTCHESKGHGWTGLQTFDDDYKLPVTRKLRMTESGKIQPESGPAPQESPSQVETPKHTPVETPKHKWPLLTDSDRLRNRGMAMSYAKDLVVAGKVSLDGLKEYAEIMYRWIMTIPPPKEHSESEPF